MKIQIVAISAIFLLSGCLASTPTTTDGEYLAWHCYGSSYDAEYEPNNFIFYAYEIADGALVNIHGDNLPATFQMDGLDAHFYFGSNGSNHALIIPPDGRAKYGDMDSGFFSLDALYQCRKAAKSR